MIGDALELGHQRAQPDGALGHLDLKRGLDGLREGHPVGHSAVARDAAGELGAFVEIGAGHQPVDALMHIAEPLFEPHHRLAIGGEAEMARLDDAGMHGPDRDLMQILALYRQEGVSLLLLCGSSCWRQAVATRPRNRDRATPSCPPRRPASSRKGRGWRVRA